MRKINEKNKQFLNIKVKAASFPWVFNSSNSEYVKMIFILSQNVKDIFYIYSIFIFVKLFKQLLDSFYNNCEQPVET